jgi:Xaa-Pro aminopeptidase
MSGSSFALTQSDVKGNIAGLQKWMNQESIDCLYISSADTYLNEYVPLWDCHRYYITGFSGSTAEVLVPANGKVQLFVDGRYHEQADSEADANIVDVVKVPYGVGIFANLVDNLNQLAPKKFAVEGERTPVSKFKKFNSNVSTQLLDRGALANIISFSSYPDSNRIEQLDLSLCGESVLDKCKRAQKAGEAFFITALDSISWISNSRGYQLDYQSSFRAQALSTSDKLFLFLNEGQEVDDKLKNDKDIEIIFTSAKESMGKIEAVLKKVNPSKLYYDTASLNSADFNDLEKIIGSDNLIIRPNGLTQMHAIKNAVEVSQFEDSFNRADTAIFNTLSWTKEQIKNGNEVSELDFYNRANNFYKEQGAKAQSFHTIAAFGANSSIMHYGASSKDIHLNESDFALLDSGGYFAGGLATDCTRTIVPKGKPTQKHIEIYTLVLKGLLNAQYAVFSPGTLGAAIDALSRAPILNAGLNYAHGTGHGVGINVHEGCYRLSPTSAIPLHAGLVGSIEPGIYIPDFGGVRLENVAQVIEHPTIPNMLCFKSLVHIGFEPTLIDDNMLNNDEKAWLADYEAKCQSRGRSF